MTGRIAFVKYAYSFIDVGGIEYFAHRTGYATQQIPAVGTVVEFELGRYGEREVAINIRAVAPQEILSQSAGSSLKQEASHNVR